ncbi:hypothetical protein LSH36_746g01085 [Paralvinella palmiformis]|uniref:Uncharacterized protein n=1 Tax=Paralvinella palmiformis TaxID=53620 RepID=A0AAD9J207_9ANNE|nr:hypothetical protein LSH36_746g01085 [Paralvinella palmiformis]
MLSYALREEKQRLCIYYESRGSSRQNGGLRYRRKRGDMLQTYQTLHGLGDMTPDGLFHLAVEDTTSMPQYESYKIVTEITDLPNQDRLLALKLPGLRYRRKRGDMLQTYQTLHGLEDMAPDGLFHLAVEDTTSMPQYESYKIVTEITDLPNQDRLLALKLPGLRYRRKRGDMLQTYQTLHGLEDMAPDGFFHLAVEDTTWMLQYETEENKM